jgi:thiamine biosynthesis lipoprotein
MIREARASSGFHLVGLCKSDQAVRFRRPGMRLDFGAIGKGFALDRAAALLREAGVESALLHGGTSSVLAIGRPPGESGWKVAVSLLEPRPPGVMKPGGEEFCITRLADSTLSVSAVSGKGFKVDDCFYGHVLDPRSGRPSKCWDLAAVVSCSATASDALSTALLIGGPGFMRGLQAGGGVEGWLAAGREGVGGIRVKRGGVFAQGLSL